MNTNNHRSTRKLLITIALAVLVLAISCGVTLAYLYTETTPVQNTFTAGKVDTEIVEDFDGTVKQNVAIKNTGNVPSYIRVMLVFTWSSEDGSLVYPTTPVAGTDYEIAYGNSAFWKQGVDGYWYYTAPVNAGDSTANLIDSVKMVEGKAPDGYYLSVEVIASSIQTTPTDAVVNSWKTGVEKVENNQLVIKEAGA